MLIIFSLIMKLMGKPVELEGKFPLKLQLKLLKLQKIRNKNFKLFLAGGMNEKRIENEGKKLGKIL